MAKKLSKIYLGYEDEVIGEKNQTVLSYKINKIGGLPNWPPLENFNFSSKCPLCGLLRPLIVQCYAPLENSIYHRTLYVFACIHPNCWIQSESWTCVRSQIQDSTTYESSTTVVLPSADTEMSWCSGADEWDENDNGDTANGNFMNVDNAPSPNNGIQRNSDEDEESNSFEIENVEHAFGNMRVFDAHNANMSPIQALQLSRCKNYVDSSLRCERKTNKQTHFHIYNITSFCLRLRSRGLLTAPPVLPTQKPSPARTTTYQFHGNRMNGAVGAIAAPTATAELEGGDEPGLVTVDTPTAPTNDVVKLLHQTSELPPELRSRLMCGTLQFTPKFIYVEEESKKASHSDDQALELLNKYKRENEINAFGGDRMSACAGGGSEDEPYEEAVPLHGDRLFYSFLLRLRNNPGQILRYSRDEPPVLGAPLPGTGNTPEPSGVPNVCTRCGAILICELQLLPEFATSLRLTGSVASLSHLHFLSVLIFTCSQSCWDSTDTFVKETVVFQPEII